MPSTRRTPASILAIFADGTPETYSVSRLLSRVSMCETLTT
jgi:hypothetical protein